MAFINDVKKADETFKILKNLSKPKNQIWNECINSYNKFIQDFCFIPIRISNNGVIQIYKKGILGFYYWVDLKLNFDLPIHKGYDSICGFISVRKCIIPSNSKINVKNYVNGDIDENLSKFMGSFISYMEKYNLIDKLKGE